MQAAWLEAGRLASKTYEELPASDAGCAKERPASDASILCSNDAICDEIDPTSISGWPRALSQRCSAWQYWVRQRPDVAFVPRS